MPRQGDGPPMLESPTQRTAVFDRFSFVLRSVGRSRRKRVVARNEVSALAGAELDRLDDQQDDGEREVAGEGERRDSSDETDRQ